MSAPPLHLRVRRKAFGDGPEERVVLSNVEVTLHEHEFVAVVGASGVGKTTLLRIAAGLDDDFEGTRSFSGVVGDPPSSTVGLVFQDDRLLPWKRVGSNVALPLHRPSWGNRLRWGLQRIVPSTSATHKDHFYSRDEVDRRVRAALSEVGLAERADAWPRELSGGMAKRVALARALVDLPRVLLLDEPFTALDAVTRARLQDHVAYLHHEHGLATLLVTHDIEEAIYLADRILLLGGDAVTREFSVDLPRPRSRTAPPFVRLREAVTDALSDVSSPIRERDATHSRGTIWSGTPGVPSIP